MKKEEEEISPAYIEFPRQSPKLETGGNIFSLIIGVLFWVIMLILFICGLYVALVGKSINYIATLFQQNVRVPFWFSLLLCIFLLPLTFVLVISVGLIRLFFDSKTS
jgi:hypothetical protein